MLQGRPARNAGELLESLWNLPAWEAESQRLLKLMNLAKSIVDRFTVATAIVRHLLTDPVLPQQLRPDPWTADDVHAAWVAYQKEFVSLPEVN